MLNMLSKSFVYSVNEAVSREKILEKGEPI